MPKAERGTPKDIANRAKAKGLSKLKFYCQMCQKQCRDENGFKCHLTSESHLRQMKVFQSNPDQVMDSFSTEFESAYLETLKRRHSTTKVNANLVYQEVIRERHHIHMNSTCWATLSDFVQYLGKVHKCVVEETERGWYVQYIDRDPLLLARQEAARKRAEAERMEEQRHMKRMDEIRREAIAKENGGALVQGPTEMDKTFSTGVAAVTIVLPPRITTAASSAAHIHATNKLSSSKALGWDDEDEDEKQKASKPDVKNHEFKPVASKKRRWDDSTTKTSHQGGSIMNAKQNEATSNNSSPVIAIKDVRKKYWLHKDIIVRVITKRLANGDYYKRKGVVTKVIDKYTAEVEILDPDGGDILKLDQDDVETVIPKAVGERVLIVNGRGRGNLAYVVRLDANKYQADLKLFAVNGHQLISDVDFEDFSQTT